VTRARRSHQAKDVKQNGIALEIALGGESEDVLAIRRGLRRVAGVCPDHDDCHENVGLALRLAERAVLAAVNAASYRADGSHDEPGAKRSAESFQLEARRIEDALEALSGGADNRGERQAFVVSAINYAATQVPPDRQKLAREIVLYAVWKVTACPLDLLVDPTAHDRAQIAVEKWRVAGGRGRTRWQPAQEFLSAFGLAAKSAAALKETAEKYGIDYAPPEFEAGSRYVTMHEFDLISQRYTGCPCCHPEQFGLPGAK